MKKFIIWITVQFLIGGWLAAQSFPEGMHFQAVARDERGVVMADQSINLLINLTSQGVSGEVFFSEGHQVTTDDQGLFALTIGMGDNQSSRLTDLPWNQQEIWLVIFREGKKQHENLLLHAAPFYGVPYAFHALAASQLTGQTEKEEEDPDHGVWLWQVCGNDNVDSTLHFLGTLDSLNGDLNFRVGERTDPYPMIITADGLLMIDKLNDSLTNTLPNLKVYADPALFGNRPENSFDSYPIRVKGGKQGMAIKVKGDPDNEAYSANNFLTFWDGDQLLGSIEGQTLSELRSSTDYKWEKATGVIKVTLPALELAANTVQTIAAFRHLFTFNFASFYNEQEFAEIGTNSAWTFLNGQEYDYIIDNLEDNVGVAFQSSGADYAEWIRKADAGDAFGFGEIVGVKAGRISRNTDGADRLLVVSRNPAVLGNMPPEGLKQQYEKVAFMGQVLTRVAGDVHPGDIILPSGRNDGLGVALSPEKMTAEDFGKMVGVAWSRSSDDSEHFVNVAVGVSPDLLAGQLIRQKEQKENLRQKLDEVIAFLQENEPAFAAQFYTSPALDTCCAGLVTGQFSSLEYVFIDQWINNQAGWIQGQFQLLETQYQKQGIDLEQYPALKELFAAPVPAVKKLIAHYYSEQLIKNDQP